MKHASKVRMADGRLLSLGEWARIADPYSGKAKAKHSKAEEFAWRSGESPEEYGMRHAAWLRGSAEYDSLAELRDRIDNPILTPYQPHMRHHAYATSSPGTKLAVSLAAIAAVGGGLYWYFNDKVA